MHFHGIRQSPGAGAAALDCRRAGSGAQAGRPLAGDHVTRPARHTTHIRPHLIMSRRGAGPGRPRRLVGWLLVCFLYLPTQACHAARHGMLRYAMPYYAWAWHARLCHAMHVVHVMGWDGMGLQSSRMFCAVGRKRKSSTTCTCTWNGHGMAWHGRALEKKRRGREGTVRNGGSVSCGPRPPHYYDMPGLPSVHAMPQCVCATCMLAARPALTDDIITPAISM